MIDFLKNIRWTAILWALLWVVVIPVIYVLGPLKLLVVAVGYGILLTLFLFSEVEL